MLGVSRPSRRDGVAPPVDIVLQRGRRGRIGRVEDLERAVAVTGVKGRVRDPARGGGDRQNAIRAGNIIVRRARCR